MKLAKHQVLAIVPEQTRSSVADFYEDFLDHKQYQYPGLSIQDAAIAFCRWRGEEISA
jgi:hypothetical protein